MAKRSNHGWAAVAGNVLAFGILSKLHAKGVLSTDELVDLLDNAILSLEELREQDEATQGARAAIADFLQHVRDRDGPGPKRP
jgi:hypothetical protein